MTKILIVEDDLSVREPLAAYLRKNKLEVVEAGDLKSADSRVEGVDLVLLDWNLPDGEGPDMMRQWRARGVKVPIIFLTAQGEIADRVVGLESGAQDYVTKPFDPRELLARIRVHVRGKDQGAAAPQTLSAHGIELDPTSREVLYLGKSLTLTKKEFDLLQLLLESRGKVFSREDLLNRIWGFENFPTTRTVDTHILTLRQKTDESLIETVRGVGYRLKK